MNSRPPIISVSSASNFMFIISILSILFPLFISFIGRGWVAKYDSLHYDESMIPDLAGKYESIDT